MLISLDGFIEGPEQDLSWFMPPEDFFELYGPEFLDDFDAILLGGRTFEMFAAYWPDSKDPTAAQINSLRKIALSRTLGEVAWNNSEVARGDLLKTVGDLKRQPGKGIVSFGGAQLASSLMELDLVDEYQLVVCPTILGAGTPLFRDTAERKQLQLLQTKTFKSGGVMLRYGRAVDGGQSV